MAGAAGVRDRYTTGAIWFHWTLAALVLVNLFIGLFDLPYLPVSKQVGGAAHNAHGLLGYVLAALVVLHVAAALRHRLVKRDAVLQRMAPGVAQRR